MRALAPLLAAFLLATPILLPDARAAPGPCDGRFGFVDCGCAFGASVLVVSCGTLEVFCDGLGDGYALAEGASTGAATQWTLSLHVADVGHSATKAGAGHAYADAIGYGGGLAGPQPGHRFSAELRADGELVAAGSVHCP
jgi:hypothetical protein